jgi:hypothetical protein
MIVRLVDHFIAASKVCKQFAPQLLNKAVKIFTNHLRTCKKHCVKLKAPKRMYYFLQRNRSLKLVNEQSYFCFSFGHFLDLINIFSYTWSSPCILYRSHRSCRERSTFYPEITDGISKLVNTEKS